MGVQVTPKSAGRWIGGRVLIRWINARPWIRIALSGVICAGLGIEMIYTTKFWAVRTLGWVAIVAGSLSIAIAIGLIASRRDENREEHK
jgi:predicted tellurium resistance membrane protein TerC